MLFVNETFDEFKKQCDHFYPVFRIQCKQIRDQHEDESEEIITCSESCCPRIIQEQKIVRVKDE